MTKKKIPSVVREMVWRKYMGNCMDGECLCCGYKISFTNCHMGHVISEYNGGEISVDNLRPICQHCNLSMGKENMDNFMHEHNIKPSKNWNSHHRKKCHVM